MPLLRCSCSLPAAAASSSRLSASAYRARITQIKHEAAHAESNVALGLQAKTRRRAQADGSTRSSPSTQRIGDEVAKLKPPQNAEAANTELAAGLHDTARATHAPSTKVAGLHTAQEAIAYIVHRPNNAKGAHEVNAAFAKLKQLGYAK